MMGNELEKKKGQLFFLGGVQKEVFPSICSLFNFSHSF